MRSFLATLSAAVLLWPVALDGQTRRTTPRAPAATAKPAATKREPADVKCPAELGQGVTTKRLYCDVLTGTSLEEGILVTLPAHTGTATLTFDLHNRQTYSEAQEKAGKAYAEYLATVNVFGPDGVAIKRVAVASTFRTANDLVDRIDGGAGPGGVKAVAPTGLETVVVEVPAKIDAVTLIGERLSVRRLDGTETFTSPGRPVAVVSNVTVEYRPAPAPAKAPAKPPAKAPAKKPTRR